MEWANLPRQRLMSKSYVSKLNAEIFIRRTDVIKSFFFPCVYWRADPPEIEIERSWIHTGVHQEAYLTCIVHAEPGANVCFITIMYSTLENK